jgi:aryl-alcohol dehydrogenase-like predicted oxidoreductase
MRTRRLPGTTLDLSVVGFGCWAAGRTWWGDDHLPGDVRDDHSVAAIRRAVDLGVNWFDTAPLYGHGHADEVLVRALGSGVRDVTIATKVGVRWDGDGAHARSDLTPAWIRQDTEDSLRRLGVEAIDLLQIHWPCELGTPLEQTLATLDALRAEGKVRYVGLCNYDVPGLEKAKACGQIDSLQTPYHLLRREFEHDLQPWCIENGVGVLAYEPLCRGLLTGKFKATQRFPESDLRSRDDRFQGTRYLRALTVVSRLELVAKRLGVPTAALAIAWVARNPAVTGVIAGAKHASQVEANVRAAELLDREDIWPEVQRLAASFRG